MKNIFNFIEPAYHLRSNSRLERHNVKSVRYETEILSHLGLKIWNFSPEEYKEIVSIKTSNWEQDVCPCRLCKTIYATYAFYVMSRSSLEINWSDESVGYWKVLKSVLDIEEPSRMMILVALLLKDVKFGKS